MKSCVSQLLGGHVPRLPPKVYAYGKSYPNHASTFAEIIPQMRVTHIRDQFVAFTDSISESWHCSDILQNALQYEQGSFNVSLSLTLLVPITEHVVFDKVMSNTPSLHAENCPDTIVLI